MYPLIKLGSTLFKARRRPALSIYDVGKIQLRAGITDIDPFIELNNARHLSAYELGRWDFSQRCGLIKVIRDNHWALAVGGASIRYRRRVPFWKQYEVTTQVLCHDGRWFYFLHEILLNGQISSSALMKAGVTSKTGLVDANTVMNALGEPDWNPPMPEWVQAWIDAESQRPWPTKAS